MKMGAATPGDWQWLVDTFQRKIGFWCNIWLSLGGRLILIKSVLQSLAVFWMTLERIPKKILTTLRRIIFHFLWSGLERKPHFHLCSWQLLSKPRRAGGWGIKNLSQFNEALLANSFWRAVSHDSIWHRIVMNKYLGTLPLHQWIRKSSFNLQRASPFWKGLLVSSPVILHWLRWKPGAGCDILLGRDRILGLEEQSLLSPCLRTLLQRQNLQTLAQVKAPSGELHFPNRWMGSGELSLSDQCAVEWASFTSALRCAGISLSDEPDVLIWAGGDATGHITVKNIYHALQLQLNICPDFSWTFQIWNWKVPLKLKLFIWLAGQGRIITWEALQRRGWVWPGHLLAMPPIFRGHQSPLRPLFLYN
jgi:hypothetical protein